MKELPSGNYALAIAHPGHELRLHGFLEQARPFVFILTDNSEEKGQDLMWDSIKSIDRATKQGMTISPAQLKQDFMRKVLKISLINGEEKEHLKDSRIEYEIVNRHTEFLNYYVDFMVENLIKYKITHLVCDASEDYHLTHEVMRMLCDLAIMKVKNRTGDDIILYDYALSETYDSRIHEHCVHLKLNQEAVERKLHAVCTYPQGIVDLAPNINMGQEETDRLRKKKRPLSFREQIGNVISNILVMLHLKDRKMIPEKEQFIFLKQALLEQNEGFFSNEYLRPARMFKETENYKNFILPVYGKMIHEAVTA